MNLLAELSSEPRQTTMKEAASRAYERCLKPFHGWIAGGSSPRCSRSLRRAKPSWTVSEATRRTRAWPKSRGGSDRCWRRFTAFLAENNLDDPTKV